MPRALIFDAGFECNTGSIPKREMNVAVAVTEKLQMELRNPMLIQFSAQSSALIS
jgi:hypothetical protein